MAWRNGQSSHSPFPEKRVCFCGEGIPVKSAPAFGAPKGSLDRYPLPANQRGCGEWERTHTGAEPFGIQLVVSYGWSLSAEHVVWPLAPLLFAVDRARKPAA